jgi:predicted component of type VI protein secretion system
MQLMLKVPGTGSSNALLLRHGQCAKIGRTEWADFCVPNDESLAEFHFALECACDAARLTDLNSGQPTLVNGKPVSVAVLRDGDQIRAGETTFLVELSGFIHDTCVMEEPIASDEAAAASEPENAPALERKPPQTLAEWSAALELSDEATELLGKDTDSWKYVDQLTEAKLYPDAMRMAGALIPAQQLVAWGAKMVSQTLGEISGPSKIAMDAALKWVAEPSETNRRLCEDAAQESEFDGPAAWIALAAFWSQGSMGPKGQPEVPAPFGLAAKAVAGALMMTATREPLKANSHYEHYLKSVSRK